MIWIGDYLEWCKVIEDMGGMVIKCTNAAFGYDGKNAVVIGAYLYDSRKGYLVVNKDKFYG